MTKLVLVAAIAENGVIGRENELPWGRSIPRDMERFKTLTTKLGAVLMGRKTAESLGKPLPGRENFVLSRSRENVPEGFTHLPSLDYLGMHWDAIKPCAVIGGAEIYRLCAPYAQRAYITRVHTAFEGDATFPIDALDSYTRKGASQSFAADESNAHALTFYTLQNNKAQRHPSSYISHQGDIE